MFQQTLELLQTRLKKYNINCDYAPGYMTLAVNERKTRAVEKWFADALFW